MIRGRTADANDRFSECLRVRALAMKMSANGRVSNGLCSKSRAAYDRRRSGLRVLVPHVIPPPAASSEFAKTSAPRD